MPNLPGVNHLDAIRVFGKLGYRVARQSKHVIMTNDVIVITISRKNPINSYTMGKIVKDAGLTTEEFRRLL